MSRIRGIEAKTQNDRLQARTRSGRLEVKNKDENPTCDDVEKKQIKDLLYKLPKLDKIFEVHRKIGEGTFSSVYLGSLKQHTGLQEDEKKWFAIKHLVPTAHPARIEHELRCMQDMGGKNHVIGVELCLRHLDTIVFVMPYIPHKKFSEYVGSMDGEELRQYMVALLTALRHVHSFGVIHRDVKPSNFLYDRENRRYLLVDFGLAQRVSPPPPGAQHVAHTAGKRARDTDESEPEAKRVALDLSVGARRARGEALVSLRATAPPPDACGCAGRGGVCAACGARGVARAARAGTQGFRPPEVLLKCVSQSCRVDTWAAGVILASVLAARYPLLRAPDDVTALAELADLIGTDALHRAATALGRRLVTSTSRPGVCLRKLCVRTRAVSPVAPHPPDPPTTRCPRCAAPPTDCLCPDPDKPACSFESGVFVAGFPDAAFSLAARLLDPDPRARLSAAEALAHPFLQRPLTPTPDSEKKASGSQCVERAQR